MNPTSYNKKDSLPKRGSDAASHVRLRRIDKSDLPVLYEYQRDPESNRLAATYPRNIGAFKAHWEKVLDDPSTIARAILVDDLLAGYVSCFKSEGHDLVGYWVGRDFWGQGIATRALELLLTQIPIRPLHARVAVTNSASLRVLEKCGFAIVRYQKTPPDDHFAECEEAVLELV